MKIYTLYIGSNPDTGSLELSTIKDVFSKHKINYSLQVVHQYTGGVGVQCARVEVIGFVLSHTLFTDLYDIVGAGNLFYTIVEAKRGDLL